MAFPHICVITPHSKSPPFIWPLLLVPSFTLNCSQTSAFTLCIPIPSTEWSSSAVSPVTQSRASPFDSGTGSSSTCCSLTGKWPWAAEARTWFVRGAWFSRASSFLWSSWIASEFIGNPYWLNCAQLNCRKSDAEISSYSIRGGDF